MSAWRIYKGLVIREDALDILLRLSREELLAVLAEFERGNRYRGLHLVKR